MGVNADDHVGVLIVVLLLEVLFTLLSSIFTTFLHHLFIERMLLYYSSVFICAIFSTDVLNSVSG